MDCGPQDAFCGRGSAWWGALWGACVALTAVTALTAVALSVRVRRRAAAARADAGGSLIGRIVIVDNKMSGGLGPAGCWAAHKRLESWARAARERTSSGGSAHSHRSTDSLPESDTTKSKETLTPPPVTQIVAEAVREVVRMQPVAGVGSYPPPHARLTRTPSISSQGSLDSSTSRTTGHRGSSPQIRAYAPDGRLDASGATGGCSAGRSPSPLRAASLDARALPAAAHGSLASLAGELPASPRAPPRCLSPLLIPPRRIDRSNSLVEGSPSLSPLPPASPGAGSVASAAGGVLGALRPDLYTRREAPMFLAAGTGARPSLGRLHLRVKYDFDRSDLNVHVIEAHDLAGCESGGFNDPYVRVRLLPEVDTRARQTAVHRNDPNPFFDQHFKFPISHDDLHDKHLLLQVFDYDRFSRNEVTGEVRIELGSLEVAGGAEVWAEIGRHRRPPEELQELLLSLSYLPSAERLTAVVLKARNLLPPNEGKDTFETYVKVYLLIKGKRAKKKKTNKKESVNPVWNEALSFSLSASNLQDASIEICVVNSSAGSPVVGWCCVGAGEPAGEGRHWAQMSQQPRKAIAMWHTLR